MATDQKTSSQVTSLRDFNHQFEPFPTNLTSLRDSLHAVHAMSNYNSQKKNTTHITHNATIYRILDPEFQNLP